MTPFAYSRPAEIDSALRLAERPGTLFLGGGTNLLDLMKGGVATPLHLVDLTRLPLAAIEELPDGGLRLGALARNTAVANHPLVRTRYPLVSQALLAGASPQLRNMATIGGNLLQRTRCHYFYDMAFEHCNKRLPGSGCDALGGVDRLHAVLGASPACVATHSSDLCVALAALRAVVRLRGPAGERVVPIGDFHRLPGDAPERDTVIEAGEIVTAVDLPRSPFASRAHYLKVRERSSYAFALVSVAAALDVEGGRVRDAALALGGVAHKPWRVPEAEAALIGRPLDAASVGAATELLLRGARPLAQNGYKVTLARRAIARALTRASEGA